MMVTGVLGFFEGLAAVIRGSFFVTLPNYAFSLSATSWGVVHIILGALLFIAGVALFADQTWARIAGVVLAAFMMIANFVYLPYYPVWAIVVIALNAFVIWALLTPRRARARPRWDRRSTSAASATTISSARPPSCSCASSR